MVPTIDRFEVFGSPVRVVDLDDLAGLNGELAAALTAESRTAPGVTRANAGGWHSTPDLSQRPAFAPLMQPLMAAVGRHIGELAQQRGLTHLPQYRFGVQAWAIVLGAGDWVIPHDHAESHLSGVYYLDAGDGPADGDSGRLVFQNPVVGAPRIPGFEMVPNTVSIEPRSGRLVLFPGYLLHFVHPYRGTRPRVAVSFNVRLEAGAA